MASFDDPGRAPTSDGNAAFGFGVSVTVGVRIAQSPGGPDGGSGTDGGGPGGGGPGTNGPGPMNCGMLATLSNSFW